MNRAIDDSPGIQQEAICCRWLKQRLILNVSKPTLAVELSTNHRRYYSDAQIKEKTVEPSVPAREFNLTAYAAIN